MKHLVVIGNGMVGHRVVERLVAKEGLAQWTVTVVGEEVHRAYDRVHLTSYLEGTPARELTLVEDGFYDHGSLSERLGDAAVALDLQSRTVRLASGLVLTYDACVLATGSTPFVPPVPGHDADGCFVYRTLDDLDAIRSRAGTATVGAVVGGGLLGLEAANALRALGLQTHIIEFAPRLMPVQVDPGGGGVLKRLIEGKGLAVKTAARTEAIETDQSGRVTALRFEDGSLLPVDLVVFSAGIRPNDLLASAAGLALGPRGGIDVDASCRTSDPHVFAAGECAHVGGRVHGLIAPGWSMAEVVAEQLLGHAGSFVHVDGGTKLKLLGVDVASFGDVHTSADGALEIKVEDPLEGRYGKLVVSGDGKTLLGGVLVGDVRNFGVLAALVGSAIPKNPASLLQPPGADGPALTVSQLPDAAVICSCNAVTKGEIGAAVRDGCDNLGLLKRQTRAGTGCGSCVSLVDQLRRAELTKLGVAVSTALCEHLPFSRQELFDVMKVRGYASFREVMAAHGTGRGCEICRPTVASVLATQHNGFVLAGERAALQDTNDFALANMQKNGTYSVVPRIAGGEVTPAGLAVIAAVATEFNLYTKITGGQRIDMFGARLEQLPAIWTKLVDGGFESGHAYGKSLRTIKSCVGESWCRYGVQDSVSLAVELELRYRGLRSPHKVKGGVSGCARECAEAQAKDIGVIATEQGWNLYVGGNGGMRPQHAVLLAQDLDKETLLTYTDRFLMFYVITADRLQRTASWLNNLEGGVEHLRSVIVEDSIGVCAELDAMMARHVDSYVDEWTQTLNDPVALRRFVSFVNAPDVPDPTISFTPEREQHRPASVPERHMLSVEAV